MAFDESKDKELQSWRSGDAEGLVVSVKQYNGGERKVQIGPREVKNKDGELRFRKAGRLTMDELRWIQKIMPEVLEVAKG